MYIYIYILNRALIRCICVYTYLTDESLEVAAVVAVVVVVVAVVVVFAAVAVVVVAAVATG